MHKEQTLFCDFICAARDLTLHKVIWLNVGELQLPLVHIWKGEEQVGHLFLPPASACSPNLHSQPPASVQKKERKCTHNHTYSVPSHIKTQRHTRTHTHTPSQRGVQCHPSLSPCSRLSILTDGFSQRDRYKGNNTSREFRSSLL